MAPGIGQTRPSHTTISECSRREHLNNTPIEKEVQYVPE